jgi:hypothetical protein
MINPPLHDGTCAAGHCRIMPDTFCRTCTRWYCITHGHHANHIDYLTDPTPTLRSGRSEHRRNTSRRTSDR